MSRPFGSRNRIKKVKVIPSTKKLHKNSTKGKKIGKAIYQKKGDKSSVKVIKPKKVYKETSRDKYLREEKEKQPKDLRSCKLLGYCPKCNFILGEVDIEKGKKETYVCPSCDHRGRVAGISKESAKKEPKKNRREFLEECQDILESMPKIHEEVDTPAEIGRADIDN